MSIPVVKRDVREIPIALVDAVELAMRDGFDDEPFRELKESIRANGIRVPIIVVARGERYRVVAGDRRYNAAKQVGAVTVPCDVQELDDNEIEFVKVLENEDRAPVNAADAAAYFVRLFERCDHDVDAVCARVRRDRRYVEDRLALVFGGDEGVFNALKAGQIFLGVAQELNKIQDPAYRAMHLDAAQRYGMTIAAARDARKTSNFATSGKPPDGGAGVLVPGAEVTPTAIGNVCYICHRSDRPERFRYVVVHEHCDLAIGQRVLSAYRESDAGDGSADV